MSYELNFEKLSEWFATWQCASCNCDYFRTVPIFLV